MKKTALELESEGIRAMARRVTKKQESKRGRKAGRNASLARVLENSPAIIYLTRPADDSAVVYVSDNFARILGRSVAEMRRGDLRLLDLIHLKDRRTYTEALRRAAEIGDAVVVYRLRDAKGCFRWFRDELRAAPVTKDGEPEVVGCMLEQPAPDDCSEEEDVFSESSEFIRRLLEACPVPIGMTRAATSEVLYESPASKALYGREPAEGPVYARDNFADPADRARYLALLRQKGRVDAFEVRMRRYDGEEFWAALSARIIEFQGEEVIVSSTYDLTQRREVESEIARQREALHQSEKLAALGGLLAGVAHELNNPLSVVVGQALLLKETAQDPQILERASRIGKAADRCARIVKTFLAMARQQPRRSERLEINEVVRNALEITAYALKTSDVEVSLRLGGSLPPVIGDTDQLSQVLVNLIMNAEHALRGQPRPRQLRISTTLRRQRGEVTIKVKDNGPGVPADIRTRIFEPLFTTKSVGTGTGIGLALCHRFVEGHGGRIKLDSIEGEGSAFTIHLPAQIAAEKAARRPEELIGRDPSCHVLVIDDEADVADVIASILDQSGHRVTIATNGSEALAQITRNRFDAILSDIKMPGLDGERLFELMVQRDPTLGRRIGFLTGDTLSPSVRTFLRSSGRPYAEKPVTANELDRLLHQIITDPSGPAL